MNLKPLNGKVLIELIEEENTSGIIIVSNNQKFLKGKVIAIPDDFYGIFLNDIVLFHKNKSEEVEYDGKTYIIIKESDISLKII